MGLITAKGTSIAVPGKKAFFMIAQGKADFRMTVPERVVFQRTSREKVDSHRTAQGKEALARSGLLTESRAQDPADSVMATSLFCATGKVPGRNAGATRAFVQFLKR